MRFLTIVKSVVAYAALAALPAVRGAIVGGQHYIQPVEDGEADLLDSLDSTSALQKRDVYTCYGSTSATVSDCENVINDIRGRGPFLLFSDVCVVFQNGTCGARLCATHYTGSRGRNYTGEWTADSLTTPLLQGCIQVGLKGIMSDNANINGPLGYFRLHLEDSHRIM
ncbi:hypothetical protein F4778DRAFT_36545 [Xylariomycetidae sp. FL2044]|nr:hypothetical protein F4778DRAFT_36545 [Xylariomycetidae sp. FL2044]